MPYVDPRSAIIFPTRPQRLAKYLPVLAFAYQCLFSKIYHYFWHVIILSSYKLAINIFKMNITHI